MKTAIAERHREEIRGAEKRREKRRPAQGEVRVVFADPERLEIGGRLVDLSTSGFRMAHHCLLLGAGDLVEFRHTEAAGWARVMWNRVNNGHVETGFLVL